MIKNIIFDLGNVVIQNPNLELVKKFFKNEEDAKKVNSFIFKSEYWKELDLGKITNKEAAEIIIRSKKIQLENYNEFTKFMLEWFKECKPNIEVMEIANKLRKNNYKIFVLSNMAESTYKHFENNYDFFKKLDGSIVSGFVGIKKPDERIFKLLVEKYKLNFNECLLIDDDDTGKTYEIANKLEIKGRNVNPNDAKDIETLLAENNIKYK